MVYTLQCCETSSSNSAFTSAKNLIKLKIPSHFPAIDFPEDNLLTAHRVELGRRLFYDTRLSQDHSKSCGSCHLQNLAFTDGIKVSEGIQKRKGKRNAPSLGNVAYQKRLFGEGGVPNLEIQVLSPIGDENEFDHDVNIIERDLQADSTLSALSRKAYNREIDMYVVTRAIAAFERTLISGNSKYDQYLEKKINLTPQEESGRQLFFSDALNCATCHSGHNFTDGLFHNIGLYESYEDQGRFKITHDKNDLGKFKTPSLRNVELTAPYMHDGSLGTLEQVIEHFNSGGESHKNKSSDIHSLNLNEIEQKALLAFLHTLTDYDFISNPNFGPIE